jgi:hypothetical protein
VPAFSSLDHSSVMWILCSSTSAHTASTSLLGRILHSCPKTLCDLFFVCISQLINLFLNFISVYCFASWANVSVPWRNCLLLPTFFSPFCTFYHSTDLDIGKREVFKQGWKIFFLIWERLERQKVDSKGIFLF